MTKKEIQVLGKKSASSQEEEGSNEWFAHYYGFIKGFQVATVIKWNPVYEGLPTQRGWYLIYWKTDVKYCYYRPKLGFDIEESEDITHWMEMPLEPKTL